MRRSYAAGSICSEGHICFGLEPLERLISRKLRRTNIMSDPAHSAMAESLDIGNKAAIGFVWLLVQSVLGRAVSVLSQLVLDRR